MHVCAGSFTLSTLPNLRHWTPPCERTVRKSVISCEVDRRSTAAAGSTAAHDCCSAHDEAQRRKQDILQPTRRHLLFGAATAAGSLGIFLNPQHNQRLLSSSAIDPQRIACDCCAYRHVSAPARQSNKNSQLRRRRGPGSLGVQDRSAGSCFEGFSAQSMGGGLQTGLTYELNLKQVQAPMCLQKQRDNDAWICSIRPLQSMA